MNARKEAAIQGFQIAILIFAVVFLNAPLDKYVYQQWEWAKDLDLSLGRALMIVSGGVLLAAIPSVRRRCADLLAPRIPRGRRREVALALAIDLVAGMGAMGGFALWNYSFGGEPGLARAMGSQPSDAVQMRDALSASNVIMFVFIAGLVGPIVEELAFRGLLYRAWLNAWGWIWAAFASALVFGLFHGTIWPQFLSGIILVVAMRRGGAIRTSIYAHALHNLLLWFPLLGQFFMPAGRSTGELHVWTPHLVCLAATAIILPWYMWSARDSRVTRNPVAEPSIA
jgi:membrane protease YdiL (CAAX protease family)